MTFAEAIEAAAGGEPILAAVVKEWPDYYSPKAVAVETPNQAVPWEMARPWLDYTWNDGFGSADCHAVYVWTASKLLAVGEYDGSTRVVSLPRDPTNIEPEYL